MNRLLLSIAMPLLLSALQACTDADSQVASPPTPSASPAVSVEVHEVQGRRLTRQVNAVGSLQSRESTIIASELTGRIARVAFDEGQPVRQGDLLFQLDDSLAQAEHKQAQATLALARRTESRSRELATRKLVSVAEVDSANAARAVAEAAAELTGARLDKHRIVAPFDGIAGLRQVSPGAYVGAGDALVQLEAVDPMKVEFRVPESVLAHLAVGQTLRLQLDAFPGTSREATVYALAPRISESSRSVAVRARLDNPDGQLRPGLFARITLDLETQADALVIPEAAVFPRGDLNYVYRVVSGQVAEAAVILGQREPGWVEVIEGLSAGDIVMTSGLQKVSPGSRVAVQRRTTTD